jgi:hypothetical protein
MIIQFGKNGSTPKESPKYSSEPTLKQKVLYSLIIVAKKHKICYLANCKGTTERF